MTTAQIETTNPAPLVSNISFEPTRKGRASRKSVAEKHPDGELIDNCINYALNVKGAAAAFNIDPTDSHFATFVDDLHGSRARKHMAAATSIAAKTLDGLRAKASLIPIIIDDFEMSPIDEYALDFLRSLAEDTKRLQQFALAAHTSHHELKAPVRAWQTSDQ